MWRCGLSFLVPAIPIFAPAEGYSRQSTEGKTLLRLPGFVFGVAELFEVAAVAFGFAGGADLSAVMDELVGEGDPAVLRNDPHQFLLDFLGRIAFGQSEAAADAEDVRIDDYPLGFAEADAEDYVGGFAGGAGEGDQLGEGFGNLAVEVRDDFAGRALDGFGFVAEEAGGLD